MDVTVTVCVVPKVYVAAIADLLQLPGEAIY